MAIAKEDAVEKPFSVAFLKKYKLGLASSVRAAIKNLSDKGIIIDFKGLRVIYWFFSLWLKQQLQRCSVPFRTTSEPAHSSYKSF